MRTTFGEKVMASDVDRCFDVDSDGGVRDALISYMVDEVEELTIEACEQEAVDN